jgi:Holliday junction resolvasome RuvABC endonuclease subunit
VLLAAGQRGIPCWSYTPQQIKGAVCGSGRAAKDQVQRMVQTLLSLEELPRPDHAADALAVAICHANSAPMRRALARQGHGRGSPMIALLSGEVAVAGRTTSCSPAAGVGYRLACPAETLGKVPRRASRPRSTRT